MRPLRAVALAALAVVSVPWGEFLAANRSDTPNVAATYERLPIYFEKNLGQTNAQVQFVARAAGFAFFITNRGAVAVLQRNVVGNASSAIVRIRFAGANKHPHADGEDRTEGKSNYFIGNEVSSWRTNIPQYAKVRLSEVYEGIDVIYYGNQREIEYDFVVRPGSDPQQIRLHIDGVEQIDTNGAGDLVLRVEGGEIRQRAPLVYQVSGCIRRRVEASYRRIAPNEFGIVLASYDRSRPLVIDPTLAYSSYLGGSGGDLALGIAVDSSGSAYVVGGTGSTDFPTSNPLQPSNHIFNAFVTKINASGSGLVYSTYLGGSGGDSALAVAVDGSGNAYITGLTGSSNFPTVNALHPSNSGGADVFVTKINASGSALVYSTYLGGSGDDIPAGIALDGAGSALLTGSTKSTDFPTANPLQANNGGGLFGAFVTRINDAGSALVYSTDLGGSGNDSARGIAVDSSGNAYIAGMTDSLDFPTVNPLQPSNGGGSDGFVTKISREGSAIVYSTYLGGNGYDDAEGGIAVDALGNAYVTGHTTSTNFPTANPLQGSNGGGDDCFVTKVNAAGTALVYSSYLGGNSTDRAFRIAVDRSGNAYVAGQTFSTNFPAVNALQATNRGMRWFRDKDQCHRHGVRVLDLPRR